MAVFGIVTSIAQFAVKCPKLTGNQVCTLFTIKRYIIIYVIFRSYRCMNVGNIFPFCWLISSLMLYLCGFNSLLLGGYNYVTFLSYQGSVYLCQQGQQIRNKYADWRMVKDVKRRRTVKEFGAERMRINSLRKNDILPQELRVSYTMR